MTRVVDLTQDWESIGPGPLRIETHAGNFAEAVFSNTPPASNRDPRAHHKITPINGLTHEGTQVVWARSAGRNPCYVVVSEPN